MSLLYLPRQPEAKDCRGRVPTMPHVRLRLAVAPCSRSAHARIIGLACASTIRSAPLHFIGKSSGGALSRVGRLGSDPFVRLFQSFTERAARLPAQQFPDQPVIRIAPTNSQWTRNVLNMQSLACNVHHHR